MPRASDLLSLYGSRIRKANFVICQSCYWCASCLKADGVVFPTCPHCGNQSLDSLPISEKEFYSIEFSEKGNVALIFGET